MQNEPHMAKPIVGVVMGYLLSDIGGEMGDNAAKNGPGRGERRLFARKGKGGDVGL